MPTTCYNTGYVLGKIPDDPVPCEYSFAHALSSQHANTDLKAFLIEGHYLELFIIKNACHGR